MSWWSDRRAWRRLVLTAVALALIAAACTAGSDAAESFDEASGPDGDSLTGSSATTVADATVEDADVTAEEPAGDRSARPRSLSPVALQTTDIGRDIIFTAELTVAVNDVAVAGEEAGRAIQSLGGFLFGQRTTGAPDPTSVLTFKVQPEDFQEALRRLGSLGEIRLQNVSADDVTDRIVDLESRIDTATASVERLRALLFQATDIKSIVELESELLARETELESLRGSLRTLQDRVALATIILTLTEAASRPAIDVTTSAYATHDGGLSCPGAQQLVVEQGTEATVCFEITNVGDTWLAGLEVRDPVLDIGLADLTVVFGDPGEPVEPGESILLAYETVPNRDLRARTTVTALPVDEQGASIPGRPASVVVGVFIGAVDPGGVPTFAEGLRASWDLLVRAGELLVLAAGALIPFAWMPVVVWLFWRTRRRRASTIPHPAATAGSRPGAE